MAPERKRAVQASDGDFASLLDLWRRTAPEWVLPEGKGGYSASTHTAYGREIEFMKRDACLGKIARRDMHPEFVQAFMDGICEFPGKQHMCLAVLGKLEEWAIVRRHLPMQITLGVKIGKSHGGHIPWTAEHVALAEQHAAPMLARAVTLAANTGQRGSELVRMGWPDIEEYEGIRGINVFSRKRKRRLWIPITAELATAMATWERTAGPFLRRGDGLWKRETLSYEWGVERDTNPALAPLRLANLKLEEGVDPGHDKGLVLHGLRGHSCVRLHRLGLTDEQIGKLVGMSTEVVKTYTRFASQKDDAIAAMQHVDRTFAERLSRKVAQSNS
jgi:hypothetical protein